MSNNHVIISITHLLPYLPLFFVRTKTMNGCEGSALRGVFFRPTNLDRFRSYIVQSLELQYHDLPQQLTFRHSNTFYILSYTS
jgi:hypothetical protein